MTIEPKFRYISAAEFRKLLGCGNFKFYDDLKKGLIPPGERLGVNTVRWRSDVVAQHLEERSHNAAAIAEEVAKKAKARSMLAVEAKRRKAAERAAGNIQHEKVAA